jgi:hypothetical protein
MLILERTIDKNYGLPYPVQSVKHELPLKMETVMDIG